MKHDKEKSADRAEQDMLEVLQAEQDAVQAIHNCENNARQITQDARDNARKIEARTDQRISEMEMRHAHKLNQRITAISKQGKADLQQEAKQHDNGENMQLIIEKLAIKLCTDK